MPQKNVPDAVADRVRELNAAISVAHTEAGAAYAEFDRTRQAVLSSGADVNPEGEAFRAADEKNRVYGEATQKLEDLRRTRDAILRLGGGEPVGDDGNNPSNGPTGFSVGDSMLESIRNSAGRLAASSDDYARMLESRAFHVNARKSVEGVLVHSGGEDGRDHLQAVLQQGLDRMSTLVTGLSSTSGGALVTPDRLPGITVPLRTRPLRLVDLITVGATNSDEISYVEMTGFTNNAAETAEATAATGATGTKPESALALVERTTTVRTVAHWIPATKRALADVGQLRTLIDQILRLGLDLRLDQQIATGDGIGENLRGIYNVVGIGAITRRATGTAGNALVGSALPENQLDVLHRAITAVRLAFFEPNAIGIHPTDFESIRLARGTAAVPNAAGGAGTYGTGDYIMGDPMQGDANTTIWGLRPVVSAAFTQGLPIVGDWSQIVMWLREGTQVLASDSHMDFFVRNLVAILAEFRAALGVLAPAAFCTAAL